MSCFDCFCANNDGPITGSTGRYYNDRFQSGDAFNKDGHAEARSNDKRWQQAGVRAGKVFVAYKFATMVYNLFVADARSAKDQVDGRHSGAHQMLPRVR